MVFGPDILERRRCRQENDRTVAVSSMMLDDRVLMIGKYHSKLILQDPGRKYSALVTNYPICWRFTSSSTSVARD